MSDLAPFVAAALKDKTVVDLKQENDELRELIDKQLVVKVTGENGSPIRYEGSLKNIGMSEMKSSNEVTRWSLFCDSKVLPLDSLWNLEIWVGGNLMERFNLDINHIIDYPCHTYESVVNWNGDGDGTVEPQMMGVIRCNRTIRGVSARFGSIPYADYEDEDLNELDLRGLKNIQQRTQAQDLIIDEIEFRTREIPGILSLLKRIGISIDYGTN